MEYRKPELDQYKSLWLTEKSYKLLKEEKKRLKKIGQGKSMAKINNDLILEKYDNENI